jgi:hypothetical protein
VWTDNVCVHVSTDNDDDDDDEGTGVQRGTQKRLANGSPTR